MYVSKETEMTEVGKRYSCKNEQTKVEHEKKFTTEKHYCHGYLDK